MDVIIDFLYFLWRICKVYALIVWRCIVPQAQKDVRGEVVLVTGAGSGIGREVALRLARRGAKLALLDINEKGLEEVTAEIHSAGGTARQYECDVTNLVTVPQVAQKIEDEIGDVTMLINNAGVAHIGDIVNIPSSKTQWIFEVNILAYIRMIKRFLPKMLDANHGHVINVASMAAFMAVPNLGEYCSTKFAVRGYTESLREDIRQVYQKAVKVSCVYPGFIATNLMKRSAMEPGRFFKILTTEAAADEIVDGILREKEEIYIPWFNRSTGIITGVSPIGVWQANTDFLKCGVVADTDDMDKD